MKNIIYLFLLFSLISCNSKPTKKEVIKKVVKTEKKVSKQKTKKISAPSVKIPPNALQKVVKIISVKQQLIMPADYLTYVMNVVSAKNDTLIFLDAYDFQSKVGDSIEVVYELKQNKKLLLCFNCTAYEGNVELYDIRAKASDAAFISLKLLRYEEDAWITPASKFIMVDSSGQEGTFYSNDNDLIIDSLLMKSDFYTYGYSKISTPRLLNQDELINTMK